jgi:hypothetical protein
LLHHAWARNTGRPALTCARGKALSSAILYLAIVAIWACVLVPRWLHRSHEHPAGEEILADSDEAPEFGEEDAEFDEDSDAPTEEFAPVGRSRTEPPNADRPAFAEPVAETYVAVETEYVHTEYVAESGYASEARTADQPEFADPRSDPHYGADPAPLASRDRVLQTRRRLLTILAALTAAAVGGTVTGITMWWIIIPPAIMLGLYLLLLREAAQADTDNEIRRAEAQAAAEAAHAAWMEHARAREALAAQAPQPEAEIIDISARTAQAKDQLYDQYADATVRAVGD